MVDEQESFEALQMENLKRNKDDGENEDELVDDDGEESDGAFGDDESRSLESDVGDEVRVTKSQTLDVFPSSEFPEKDRCDGVYLNSTSKSNDGAQSENGVLQEEAPAVATLNDASAPLEKQHKSTECRTLSELSPTSVTQPISSATSPTPMDHGLSPKKYNDLSKSKGDPQKDSSPIKAVTPISVMKVPSSDGYNWRKYGQKQVKSPTGSRSYYKCTYSQCFAKKIECNDHLGSVTEVVYKSQHSHDPPRKSSSGRDNKLSSAERVSGNNVAKQPCRALKDSDPSASVKKSIDEAPLCLDRKRQSLVDTGEDGDIVVESDAHENEPEPKRRMKKSHLDYQGSLVKSSKKAKFVVHADGGVGISADGYRWRKYGQKMVKGNPHPRNYYRCTSAGCPVRKHIETSVDNANAVILTYKGVHDHDMPVPKKRHGPPSAPLVAASAPASMSNAQLKKPETVQNPTQLTGEASDLGGEKAMDSARTLLSIGFEIKPC